jgi:hypothetical protein
MSNFIKIVEFLWNHPEQLTLVAVVGIYFNERCRYFTEVTSNFSWGMTKLYTNLLWNYIGFSIISLRVEDMNLPEEEKIFNGLRRAEEELCAVFIPEHPKCNICDYQSMGFHLSEIAVSKLNAIRLYGENIKNKMSPNEALKDVLEKNKNVSIPDLKWAWKKFNKDYQWSKYLFAFHLSWIPKFHNILQFKIRLQINKLGKCLIKWSKINL